MIVTIDKLLILRSNDWRIVYIKEHVQYMTPFSCNGNIEITFRERINNY